MNLTTLHMNLRCPKHMQHLYTATDNQGPFPLTLIPRIEEGVTRWEVSFAGWFCPRGDLLCEEFWTANVG